MFVDTIVDDRANVRDVEISVECMIGKIPRRVDYGSEKFRLVSLHNCYIGFRHTFEREKGKYSANYIRLNWYVLFCTL